MAFVDSLVVFLVSLVIGSIGIHLGAGIVVGESDYSSAVVTALIGALVWGVVGFLFGFIPLLGPLITLLAWIAVINARYSGGWGNAAAIGFLAWLTVLVILYVLALLGITAFSAVGIPGV